MALIDEYKQAIQDVLDGRAKPAPKPSELPWTEDKLASMWAAAAAELIAEENASGGGSSGGGVLVVNDVNGTLDKTWKEIADAASAGIMPVLFVDCNGEHGDAGVLLSYYIEDGVYIVEFGTFSYTANSESGYPASTT